MYFELKNDLTLFEGSVEYWGEPQIAEINNSYAAQRVSVNRNGPFLKLSGRSANSDDTSSSLIAIKLTGDLARTATISGYNAFDKDLSFLEGHTYTISFKILSGGFSPLASNDANYISLSTRNESNNAVFGPIRLYQEETLAFDTFTATEDVSFSFFLYISKGIEFSENTQVWIQIQDITEAIKQNGLANYLNEYINSINSLAENMISAESATRETNDSALSNKIDGISEYQLKTKVTDNLNSTRYGVTFQWEDENTIKTFGTGTAARRILWLNGQDAGKITTSDFEETLPAGVYKITIDSSGISDTATIRYTYSTFANDSTLYTAGSGEKSFVFEFTQPVMLALGVSTSTNYGTEDNPGKVYFKAEQFTAVDHIARTEIDQIEEAITPKPEYKIAFFGDSIIWGRDGNSSAGAQVEKTIPDVLAEKLNIKCTNYGVGSQGYVATATASGNNAYATISSTDLSEYDIVILAYGVNDGFRDLGSSDSTDEETIMGQFNKILNYLYTQYPTIRVIVVAPWNGRNIGTAPDYWYGPRNNSSGYVSRKILSDALKARCDYFWIPYIEVYDSPINPFTIGTALPDGVHPSAEYYLQIGSWLAGKLRNLL